MAWYSVLSNVYHFDTRCTEGNNIEAVNRRSGTGNRRPCSNCRR